MSKQMLDYRSILGDPMTRLEVIKRIESDSISYQRFQNLSEALQEELIAFCMGNWGLNLTYDPFFKYIFNPELHPERLSEFLSLLLNTKVEILSVIPNESHRISDAGSLLITDILIKLEDGSYANIEIQKMGYMFPGERCACYSCDMMMRQLAQLRNEAKVKKQKFKYNMVKKVYTIVLIEDSIPLYHAHPNDYIHRSKQIFDTGLQLDLLQEYIIIPLDVFKKIPHNKINKLEAWLYFIGSDAPQDISRVVNTYPEFKALYNELLMLRYKPKELIYMFDIYREILREADEEAVKYMVEEQKKIMAAQENIISERNDIISEQNNTISKQSNKISEQSNKISEQSNKISEQDKIIAQQQEEIERLKQQLNNQK